MGAAGNKKPKKPGKSKKPAYEANEKESDNKFIFKKK